MEALDNSRITTVLFEHACKEDYENIIHNILEDNELDSKICENSATPELRHPVQPRIKPLFMLIYLLRKLQKSDFTKDGIFKNSASKCLFPRIIDLLESTYKQCDFVSLQKFLRLISELKLLDLLNSVVENLESPLVVQKLNQYFPHWTSGYRASLEKKFSIKNSKVLDTVEENHKQCRRLILKLAVDKVFRAKYISDQYSNDLNTITSESKAYIMIIIEALELYAGSSALEKMVSTEEKDAQNDDLAVQLLFEYVHPQITEEALFRYLDDFEPTFSSQPVFSVASCLRPFDTMSEMSDSDSNQSSSEFESSQDVGDSIKSFAGILPEESALKSSDVCMEEDL